MLLEIVIYAIFIIVYLLLVGKILDKMGFPKWWAVFGLIPLVNLAALLKIAYARWPNYPNR